MITGIFVKSVIGEIKHGIKYYAVKKGKVPGIYFNWNDCKAMVDGYQGAVYKSFKTIEEAEKLY